MTKTWKTLIKFYSLKRREIWRVLLLSAVLGIWVIFARIPPQNPLEVVYPNFGAEKPVQADFDPNKCYERYTDKQCWKLALYMEVLNQGLTWKDYKKLEAIGEAESRWNQYDKDGKVLLGPDGKDSGIFQIRDVHLPKAQELGFDLATPIGNMDFALHLYSKRGTRDWNASRHKWIKML